MASSPFGQALVLLIRLLGDMHRDHLELVREELEQIRRIHVEMNATRAALGRPDPGTGGEATSAGGTAADGDPGAETGPAHLRLWIPRMSTASWGSASPPGRRSGGAAGSG